MYIYIGQYYHKRGKELNIKDKKIGRTLNVENREYNLNDTKGPIGYSMVAAWDVGDQVWIERALHGIYDDRRSEGEWFDDEQDTLITCVAKFMKEGNFPKIALQSDDDTGGLIDEINKGITRRERYEEFWTGWVEFCAENSKLRPQAAGGHHWNTTTIGVRSVNINNTISKLEKRMSTCLYTNRYGSHDFFKTLHDRKVEIEEAFGEPLIWDYKENRLSIRIGLDLNGVDFTDSSKYYDHYKWLLEKNLRICEVLVPYAHEFEWPVESSDIQPPTSDIPEIEADCLNVL